MSTEPRRLPDSETPARPSQPARLPQRRVRRRPVRRGPVRRKGGTGRIIGVAVVLAAAIGYAAVSCGESSTPDMGTRKPPPADVLLTGDKVLSYQQHLIARGIYIPDYVPADTIRLGWLVCTHLEIVEAPSISYEVDRIEQYTRDQALAAVIVDAAVDHLCEGIDK